GRGVPSWRARLRGAVRGEARPPEAADAAPPPPHRPGRGGRVDALLPQGDGPNRGRGADPRLSRLHARAARRAHDQPVGDGRRWYLPPSHMTDSDDPSGRPTVTSRLGDLRP